MIAENPAVGIGMIAMREIDVVQVEILTGLVVEVTGGVEAETGLNVAK